MNNKEYNNKNNKRYCDKNNEEYYNKNNEEYCDKNNEGYEGYYNKNNKGYYNNIELEYVDADLELVESVSINADLKIEESKHLEVESNGYVVSTDDLNISEISYNLAAFITEELQLFSILKLQTLIKIIEDLDPQASVLNKDQLKEILINTEDRV
ncbi:6401_t:CDS:2, partial [Racocetra fulgida]